jgi:hypothetical protein
MIKAAASLLAATALVATAFADIQQPPGSDYGPTRKLGRGLGNVLFGPTELLDSMAAYEHPHAAVKRWLREE